MSLAGTTLQVQFHACCEKEGCLEDFWLTPGSRHLVSPGPYPMYLFHLLMRMFLFTVRNHDHAHHNFPESCGPASELSK